MRYVVRSERSPPLKAVKRLGPRRGYPAAVTRAVARAPRRREREARESFETQTWQVRSVRWLHVHRIQRGPMLAVVAGYCAPCGGIRGQALASRVSHHASRPAKRIASC